MRFWVLLALLALLAYVLAHWAVTGLPLVVATPLFGLMLALEGDALWGVAASLAAGTPALTFIGAIGAALTVSLRRGGLLMASLVLPFTVPVLIFGVSAASSHVTRCPARSVNSCWTVGRYFAQARQSSVVVRCTKMSRNSRSVVSRKRRDRSTTSAV